MFEPVLVKNQNRPFYFYIDILSKFVMIKLYIKNLTIKKGKGGLS